MHHGVQFQKVAHNAPHCAQMPIIIFLSSGAQMPLKRCRQTDMREGIARESRPDQEFESLRVGWSDRFDLDSGSKIVFFCI